MIAPMLGPDEVLEEKTPAIDEETLYDDEMREECK